MDRFNPEDLHKKGFVPDGQGGYKKATGHEKSLIERMGEASDSIFISQQKMKAAIATLPPKMILDPTLFPEQSAEEVIKAFKEVGYIYATSVDHDPEAVNIRLHPDHRDMEEVAKNYLAHLQIPFTKNNIAAAIKQIQRQEAEDYLMHRNPLTEFYIPGEVRSTKNHTRIMKRRDGTRFIGKAAATVAAEKIQVWDYKGAAPAFRLVTEDRALPLFVMFTYIMSTDAHFDFLNLTQGPADQMQKCGWIRNDSRKHIVPIFNPRVYIHPEQTGVVISIL